jgi:hypothetical protein
MDATIGGAADYNAVAVHEGWHSLCDSTLQFAHPELIKLLELWRTNAGATGIPPRREMSARMLKSMLRDVAIYERVTSPDGRRRYRVRLIGSGFAQIVGDLTGKFIDDAVATALVPRWHGSLDATLGAAAPLRFVAREETNGMIFLTGEFFSAPLMADDGQINLVLGSARYSGKRPWPEVESETRQMLGLR